MKREKGGIVAPEQRDWLEYLNEVGYTAIVARGLEDAKAQVIEHAQTFDFLRKVVG